MAKANPPKIARNLRLFSDRVFKVLTFAQLARKYDISHTTAHELYMKALKRYKGLTEREIEELINGTGHTGSRERMCVVQVQKKSR